MTHTASAGFEQNGSTQKRGCGLSSMGRWSAWEIGAMVAGFVVFWPLGLIALFLKWKNGEMWKGSADTAAPWASFKLAGHSSGGARPHICWTLPTPTSHTSHKHSPHRHKLQGPNWSLPGSHMLINIQHRFATTCSHTDSMHPPSRPLLRPPSSLSSLHAARLAIPPRRVLRPSSVPPRVLRPTHTRHAATSRSLR